MNKATMIIIAMMMLLPGIYAASTPLNSTYTMSEFQNMTGADNLFDIVLEINSWLGGMFGLMIWIAVIVISFLLVVTSTTDTLKAMVFSTFAGSITAIFLFIAGLTSAMILYGSFIGLLISIGILKASN